MSRKKKSEPPPLAVRVTLLVEARDALVEGALPSKEALDALMPMLDLLCRAGQQAIDQLAHVQESMRTAPINAVLRDLLLFNLMRWPLEPSEAVRERILTDAQQAVRGKPLEAPRREQAPGSMRIGGKDYGISGDSAFADVL